MFSKGFRGKGFARKVSAVFAAAVVLSLAGCGGDDDEFVDDHKLNSGLIGTWFADFGGGYTDTYTISATTISHPDGWPAYADAHIEYVYNFSETAGCIIIKRTEDNKFNAVYFKNLGITTVLLGDAYDTTIVYPADTDSSVTSLDLAKARFTPEQAERWGGGSAQGGSPQTRQ